MMSTTDVVLKRSSATRSVCLDEASHRPVMALSVHHSSVVAFGRGQMFSGDLRQSSVWSRFQRPVSTIPTTAKSSLALC